MKATCKQIAEALERYAPRFLQEEWDNTGLLLGSFGKEVSRVLVTLDVLDGVVGEALGIGADMIVSHHPVIFKGVRGINDGSSAGKRLLTLIKNDIAVYAAHTNLDVAEGGTNDTLFDALGLENKQNLWPPANGYPAGLGRVGDLPEAMTLRAFAERVKTATSAACVTYAGDGGAAVRRVGLCTGAGADMDHFTLAREKGCDVYVTGDVTHHKALDALDMGLCLVDATHYYSEALINSVLCAFLKRFFMENGLNTDVCVSAVNGQPLTPL